MKSSHAKNQIAVACLLAALAVIFGAFGAHGLKRILSVEELQTFEVAVRYQMYHALGIFFVGILSELNPVSSLQNVGRLFLAGILVFSGSLYLLLLTGAKWFGAITPIGGIFFIVAWVWLAVHFATGRVRH